MQTPPPSGNSPAYGVLRCAAAGLDGGAAGGRGAWRARLSAALAGALVLAAAASWALWPRPAVQREALQRGREGPEDGVVQLHSQRALRHPQVSTSQLQGVGDPVEPLQGLATSAWDPATSTAEGPRSSAEGPTATSTEDPAAISTEGPATSTEELAASTTEDPAAISTEGHATSTEDLAATTEGLATSSEDAEVEAALRSRSTAPPSSAGAAAGARAGSAGPILPPRGFQCGPGRRGLAGIQMLHVLEDTWKLDRADKSAREHGFRIDWSESIWPGVICKDQPDVVEHAVDSGWIIDPRGHALGNVGAALAHLTLWESIAQKLGPADIVLVMEDNVLFTPRSLNGTCDAIAAAGDFDYLALAVKRPLGTPFRPDLGLREVKKARVTEPMPNVWMSSYLVTGNGAVKLLGCLKRQVQNYGSNIIDRVVSRQCLSGDESIKAFIVDHDRFFGHVETLGDTRIKQNMDAAVHHKRYSHIR